VKAATYHPTITRLFKRASELVVAHSLTSTEFKGHPTAIDGVPSRRVRSHGGHSYREASNPVSAIAAIHGCQGVDELQPTMEADIDVHGSNQESA